MTILFRVIGCFVLVMSIGHAAQLRFDSVRIFFAGTGAAIDQKKLITLENWATARPAEQVIWMKMYSIINRID